MKAGVSKYIAITILCLPLFFINVKSSHDWGDDFAQYIHQAKNICEGIPQSDAGYIYNPDYPSYAPPSYPSGFPLILAPVYSIFGNSILHFEICISLFLFAFALLLFHFLLRFFSPLISGILIIIFIYNPWMLWFKLEITSDIPFAFFFLMAVLLYEKDDKFTTVKIISLILITGFMISIRNIGIVFILAILWDLFRTQLKKKDFVFNLTKNRKFFAGLIICVLSFLFFMLLNKIIFPSSADGLFSYKYFFNFSGLRHFIQTNLTYYMSVLRAFFEPWNDEWQFVALFSGTMIFAFIILGMIKKMTTQFDFSDSLMLIYLSVIIVYPYSNAGFRFLIPLAPFFLYYLVIGIGTVNIRFNIKPVNLALAMAVFVLFSYQKGFSEIWKNRNTIVSGPQEKKYQEMFSYISKNSPADASFCFKHPRALALYTNRRSMITGRNQTTNEIHQSLAKNNINYVIIKNEETADSLYAYTQTHERNVEKVWGNEGCTVYRLIR